ncbi:MAG: glycosyltransferase [Betaproteobacteria bacterium]|nr:glycosyltransferase [Betaproteobacteria bacterium]
MKSDNIFNSTSSVMQPALSVVVPVLNEAALISDVLTSLAALRSRGCEVIVVDGGSSDGTVELAEASGLADVVLCSARGRAVQMNAGAACARARVLLFLHADTRLPEAAVRSILGALHASAGQGTASAPRALPERWGRFDVCITGNHWLLPAVAWSMNLRSRLSGIATGDQAMFVTRSLFERCGGFPAQALMEDVALSARLRRESAPLCLRDRVCTSGRRWEQNGVLQTILLMWRLRLAYFFGASPQALARQYQVRRVEGRENRREVQR